MPSRVIESSQEVPADVAPNGNGVVAPPAASSSASTTDDDLDALLKQFEDGTARPAQTNDFPFRSQEAINRDLELANIEIQRGALADERGQLETYLQREAFNREIMSTVEQCRGDLDRELFDDDLVVSWLDLQARKDPSLQQAILERNENPRAWAAAKNRLATEFQKYSRQHPDREITEDVAAVTAAVRGAQGAPPAEQEPNFSLMSDQEFRQWQRDHGYGSVA